MSGLVASQSKCPDALKFRMSQVLEGLGEGSQYPSPSLPSSIPVGTVRFARAKSSGVGMPSR